MTTETTLALEISLLGPFRIRQRGGAEIKESRRKSRALLAWLLLESNRPHSREHLISLLWPEMDLNSGRQNLRVTLSRLRKQLADHDALETTRHSVALHQSPHHLVDSLEFERLIKATETHSHRQLERCNGCLDKLKKALTYYRGPFLAGLNLAASEDFEEWVSVWRERLFLQLIDLLDKLAQAYLARGDFEQALVYTRRQLELDPLYDLAQKRVLRLLALQNNIQGALSQFEQIKMRLMFELGIEPDQEMQDLVAEIRSGRLALLKTATSSQSVTPAQKNGNLPESLTPFFGRQPELKRLAEKLAQPDYRLITLVGQGGIGKSRLAIEAARTNQSHFSDGAFFIPLAPITRIDQIPSAIGTEIGLHFQSTDQSLEEQLIRFLTDKEMLLIIDNMEHMLDGADLLLSILRLCPHVVLLVTSRHTLDLQAEDLFQIEGLPYPTGPDTGREIDQFPAIRLFCNRAHRLLKTFRLSPQNQSDVVSICRLTEGLPLALELAASWVRDFPLPDIVEAIEDNYAFLQSTSRDLPPQHRSIQAVLEYSWGLLSQPEQALLAALSLFRGRFSATSIAAVTGATPIDLIRLCNQSLVRRVPGTGRYELHELTRQFAAEKLEADPTSLIELERKHARHYLSILRDEREPLIHKEPIPAFERLQIEGDNISIAWERGLTHGLVRPLLDGVQAFVYVHIRSGQSHSMIDMLDRSLEMLPDGPTHTPQNHLKCLFLTYKGYLLARLQDQRAFDVSQTSYSLAQTIKDPYLVAFNHYIKGWSISDSQSELLTDLEMYDQGERIARVYQFIDILMMITRAKGHHHFLNKQFELAEKYCKESVSLGQQHQLHPDIQVQALGELGNIVSAQGHHGAALQYHAQALDLQEVSGNPRDRAVILHYLTCAQLLVGLNRAAIQSEKAAIKIFDDIGDHFLGNWVRITLAEALRKDDQQPEALRILKAIRFERKTEAASRVKCLYRMEMGDNYLASEAWSKAKEQFHLAIQNASKLKFPDEYYLAQSGYAYAKSMEGDPNGAYHHFYPLIEEFSGADRSGWQDAVILFLRSFLILSAVAHEQATDLLMEGKSIVDELLSKVNDHKIRRSMLENIPEHRDLLYFVSQL